MTTETWSSGRGKLRVSCRVRSIEVRDRVEVCEVRVSQPSSGSPPLYSTLELRTYSAEQIEQTLGAEPRLETVALYTFAYKKRSGVELEPWYEDTIFVLRKTGS